jgi:RNA polymerase sigma-70 factor (ECF subfamily)
MTLPQLPAEVDASPLLTQALERFRGVFEGVARRFRLEPIDREELLQEVRIRLWNAQNRGESVSQVPASYLWRTAESAAIDLFRRRRTHVRREERLSSGAYERPGDLNAATDAGALETDLAARVEDALLQLRETRRLVVRMHLAGYSRIEIAGTMQWSEAKVRNLLYRGLADLRLILEARGIGPGGT